MGREERQAVLRARIRELAASDLPDLDVVRDCARRARPRIRERPGSRAAASACRRDLAGACAGASTTLRLVGARRCARARRRRSARTLAAVGFAVFRTSTAIWVVEGGSLPEIVEAGSTSWAEGESFVVRR